MSILAILIAYLLGAIPFGYLLTKWKTGKDIQQLGSGNIGATNVLRTAGRALGIATLLLDIAKGFAALWIAARLTGNSPIAESLAALAVIAGHAYPVFLRFQGGKAVATFTGAFLFIAPLPLLATAIVFVVVVTVSRYISLGSILSAGLFPLALLLIDHPETPLLLAAIVGGAFLIWRHKENIHRLRAGNENVLRLGGKRT
ncbi:MAG: glycerol-3-phosphate 1-O-acyltransferase PlsY [Candidatus Solibacter usitatus]|nr:glycerol-3-phosphate 1-O-acyltransferase PlsY [Candidatus Solibacter usitatus]